MPTAGSRFVPELSVIETGRFVEVGLETVRLGAGAVDAARVGVTLPGASGPGKTANVSFSFNATCRSGSFDATNLPAIALSSDWAARVLIPSILGRYALN